MKSKKLSKLLSLTLLTGVLSVSISSSPARASELKTSSTNNTKKTSSIRS